MTVDPIHGTDVESLAFHLPVLDTTNDHDDDSIRFHSAFRHTTHEGPHSLQATCAKYFVDTQAAFDHSVHDLSMWSFAPDKGGEGVALRWNAETKRVECYRDGKTTTRCTLLRSRDAVSMLPSGPSSMYPSCPILEGHRNASSLCQLGQTWRHLKNAGDKCFSYSGYHRLVVTNPHDVHNNITAPPAALHLESVPGRPFCKFASWSNDEATCHAKRTQWYMTLGCCKSYGTIVADERAKGHPLPDRGDVGALVYEKTFAALDKSDSRVGARPPRLVAAPWDDRDSTSTTDDPSLLHTLMQQWVPYCTQQKRGSSRTVAPPDETDMDETEVMWCPPPSLATTAAVDTAVQPNDPPHKKNKRAKSYGSYLPLGPTQRTYCATVSYDGTGFVGFQLQDHERNVANNSSSSSSRTSTAKAVRTVQLVLEDALLRTTGETIRIRGASRTDKGVHAVGQVVAFTSAVAIDSNEVFLRALNTRLPDDVVRPYCISLFTSRHMSKELDVDKMVEAAAWLQNDVAQDFRQFTPAKALAPDKSTLCTVTKVHLWTDKADQTVHIQVVGNRFLYKMVRTIVGVLVEVGLGRATSQQVQLMMAQPMASHRSISTGAPPHGLVLQWIQLIET
ncbi:hypothetical protein DYB31_005646 [Aphanomyces astaci]|uniref:Pseudouridine synthase I TruA alpha/beta domain-containing protein n=2 Tax=Aphanomyces astaci TaxID=112090 RepID=A0A397EZI4_APHAT|nr:hypothetical protein DYB31_005646 [Aphanomyces astaci]